jgi:hypothetical protein
MSANPDRNMKIAVHSSIHKQLLKRNMAAFRKVDESLVFNLSNPSARKEMSTRSRKMMFLVSRARPVRRAICEPIV